MDAVRAGAAGLFRYLVALFFVGCVVQFFLAGYGAFSRPIEFDPHETLGYVLMGAALVLFALAMLSWRRELMAPTAVLFVLAAVVQQPLAADGEPWVGAFHALNGLLVLGLSGALAHRSWVAEMRRRRAAGEA